MTVAAFNLLETFLEARLKELAEYVNSGNSQFLDLPDRLQKRAISQTLTVATAKLKRNSYTLPELRTFSESIGQNIGTTRDSLSLSHFTWLWAGSNMGADDFGVALGFFQVEKPWQATRELIDRLSFQTTDHNGDEIDFQSDLRALGIERNRAAHVASHPITSLWLRAVPDRILRLAASFDMIASAGAHLLRTGDRDLLSGQTWVPSQRITLRFVRKRARDYAEFAEGRSTAYRVSSDGTGLFAQACTRCSDLEGVVLQGPANEVQAWAMPCVS